MPEPDELPDDLKDLDEYLEPEQRDTYDNFRSHVQVNQLPGSVDSRTGPYAGYVSSMPVAPLPFPQTRHRVEEYMLSEQWKADGDVWITEGAALPSDSTEVLHGFSPKITNPTLTSPGDNASDIEQLSVATHELYENY